MGKRSSAVLIGVVALVGAMTAGTPAQASPAEQYSGANFGDGNLPAGCVADMSPDNPANICHHMRTGLNGLDSPQIDVLVVVPASPTAERDLRIMRQAVEMWEGGIDYLAPQMGLDWLGAGVDFHITVDAIDPAGDNGGEFTTYPVVDPEVVVLASNPVGGIGIGIDPVYVASKLEDVATDGNPLVFTDEDRVPCHGAENPFDFEQWDSLPGFDSHHDGRSGTYNEDCGGAGGNVCFAVTGAIDPAPDTVELFSLFDIVAHEVGHCLSLGHVGDGAEGAWGVLPPNDIMAYSSDPQGLNKCVSTLDVEGFAVRMSRYLDVNGDSAIDAADRLEANDQAGAGGDAFQVQHPDDHLYASATGAPIDCPQPDIGPVPGARTDWTPTPVSVADPTSPTASFDDLDDDATTAMTEIRMLDVAVTATHVEVRMRLADLWPSTSVFSGVSYSALIDGRKFDSFVRYPFDANPMTWDSSALGYLPAGSSTWDTATKTVTFRIPRAYLGDAGITSPYFVSSQANVGSLLSARADDRAPELGNRLGVAG